MGKKKKAFTLAEVLIVLAILGVIASIVIPPMIRNHSRMLTQAKIAKFYSNIGNLIGTAEVYNGRKFSSWNFANRDEIINTYIAPFLAIQQDCRTNACSYTYYYQKGAGAATFKPMFVLKDGTAFSISTNTNQWGDNGWGHIMFTYDINGSKKPNRRGVDIFWLSVYNDSSIDDYYLGAMNFNKNFTNIDRAINLCKTELSSGNGGLYCAGWIYSNGFKIPKDYPWL